MNPNGPLEPEFDIIERLAKIVEAAAPAAEHLARLKDIRKRGACPTHEERLTAYRAVRNDRLVPPEAAFYLIAYQIMDLAQERYEDDPRLEAISCEMEQIEEAHGLTEDEYWPIGEGPEDHRALDARWNEAADAIIAETFRAQGEGAMADLFEGDRAEFDRRFEVGRRFFHSEERA